MQFMLLKIIFIISICSGTIIENIPDSELDIIGNLTNNINLTSSGNLTIGTNPNKEVGLEIDTKPNDNKPNKTNPPIDDEPAGKKICRIFFQDQPKIRDYYLNEFLLAYVKNISLTNQTNSSTSKMSHNNEIANIMSNSDISSSSENFLAENKNKKSFTMIEKVAKFKEELN